MLLIDCLRSQKKVAGRLQAAISLRLEPVLLILITDYGRSRNLDDRIRVMDILELVEERMKP